jgi:hypothetical protein
MFAGSKTLIAGWSEESKVVWVPILELTVMSMRLLEIRMPIVKQLREVSELQMV